MAATHTLQGRIEAVETIAIVDREPLTVISVVDEKDSLKVCYGGRSLQNALLDLWPAGWEGHRVAISLHGHVADSIRSMEGAP